MYKKNDCLTVAITDMGIQGEGIGKVEGYTLFVKDAVIGDTVEVKIMRAKKSYAYAHLEKVIVPSPFRAVPKCRVAKACGGCQLQAVDYEKQLEFKYSKVKNNLLRLGGFSEEELDAVMEPIVGMEEPYGYRGKSQFPFGEDKEGNIITGFYAGHSHSIIANTECIIGVEENKEILEIILEHMKEYGMRAYDENTGKGLLRHALIRKGFSTGEIMVCLVLNCQKPMYDGGKSFLAGQNELLEKLGKIQGMTSISVSLNTENTNVIMGLEIRNLWGQEVIHDTIHRCDVENNFKVLDEGLTYAISPLSFYQVNPLQTERLYSIALDYAKLTGKEAVWDLYCGIGTISLFLAQAARKVYGVEIIPEAIMDAEKNAVSNNITNVKFFTGKAEEVLSEFYNRGGESDSTAEGAKINAETSKVKTGDETKVMSTDKTSMLSPDVIVVDPPRKGCDKECLDTMLKMSPDRIVYVSCDSATLARDLKILVEGGYTLQKVRPVDMFPHGVHVESVVLLSQQKADDYLEVEIDLDELDATSAETKATYEEIKKYVAEHNDGMKVSNLYIAQVKKKCGIELGQNFNLPKSENAKQPQCPKEKEDAIVEALKAFQMI